MSKQFATLEEVVSQLTNSMNSSEPWGVNSLTFSFPTQLSSDHEGMDGADTFSAFTTAQQAAARLALSAIAEVIDVTFTEVDGNGGDIRFHNLGSLNGEYGQAFASGPGPGIGGDVFVSPTNVNYHDLLNPVLGDGHGFITYLHEIGHALGLGHAGNYNGGSPTYLDDALFSQDTEQYTVMSYFWAADAGADQFNEQGNPQFAETLMLYDIAALQSLYGANPTTRLGDTTYGFNSNAGGPYDFASNNDPVVCIYDAGGIDTLNFSGFTGATLLNLNGGSYSNSDFMTGNVSIAFGTVIENGIGGSGDDMILGNHVNNFLVGNAGNDTIHGADGNDQIYAGSGDLGADILYGDGGSDTIGGGAGNDTLDGGLGDDVLFGGAGDDEAFGQDGNDVIWMGAGNDAGWGGDGNDTIGGGAGSDDEFGGGDGNDVMYGGADDGNDGMGGGDGDDTLFGGAGNDSVGGGLGDDLLFNGAGDDIVGGDSDNNPLGGNDTLWGGGGNDTLWGDRGADVFAFEAGNGNDVVTDFAFSENDKLDLSSFAFANVADALGHFVDVGGKAVLTVGDVTVTFSDVVTADFQANQGAILI